jgi:hypothetical protein
VAGVGLSYWFRRTTIAAASVEVIADSQANPFTAEAVADVPSSFRPPTQKIDYNRVLNQLAANPEASRRSTRNRSPARMRN